MAGKEETLREKTKELCRKVREKVMTASNKIRKKGDGAAKKNKQSALPVIKAGPRRKWIIAFWILLAISIVLGIYNNFTAVDTETVIEKEIVEEKLKDTNALESFVTAFAKLYHSWSNSQDGIAERQQEIGAYITEELARINKGNITTDCPTTAQVKEVHIWVLEETKENEYRICYSVVQEITENGEVREEENAYETCVHLDQSGNMIVIRNPTACALPKKSSYEPITRETDGSIGSIERKEIDEFLNTFFSLYPQADDNALVYYIKDKALSAIKKDYIYSGLENAVYYMDGNEVKADVYVRYLDQDAKITQIFQYMLVLEKGENWRIVRVE